MQSENSEFRDFLSNHQLQVDFLRTEIVPALFESCIADERTNLKLCRLGIEATELRVTEREGLPWTST